MSILLGVLSSGQKGEENPFREGIIQQPGSFYSDNSSSSIWGNNPTPSLWGNFSSPNVVPISVPSGAPDFVFTSSSNSKNTRMVKESRVSQASDYSARDQTNQMTGVSGYAPNTRTGQSASQKFMSRSSSDNNSKGRGAGHAAHVNPTTVESKQTVKKSGVAPDKEAGPSVPSDHQSDSSSNFIFSSQASKSAHASSSDSSYMSTKSRIDPQSGSQSLDNRQWKDIHAKPDNGSVNDKKIKSAAFGDIGNEFKSESQVPRNTEFQFSSTRVTSSPLEVPKQSFGREQPNSVPTDKKSDNPGVFIFGASGSSISSLFSQQNNPGSHQKSFHSSYSAPVSKARHSKFKRHSNAVKAKPAAPMGSQPGASEFRKEIGADSEADTHADRLQKLYADDWQQPENNINSTSETFPSGNISVEDFKHEKNVQGRFGSWYPFSDHVSNRAGKGTAESFCKEGVSEPTQDKTQKYTEKMNPDILEKEVRGTIHPGQGSVPQKARESFAFGSSCASNSCFVGVSYGGSGGASNVTAEPDDSQKQNFTWSDAVSSSNYDSKYSVNSGSTGVCFTAAMDQNTHRASQPSYNFGRENELPTGEFSGPVSSTDSSDSENSPGKGQRSKPATPKEYFEFQGSSSQPPIGRPSGKKKVRSFSSTRRPRRGITSTRKSNCNEGAQPNMATEATMSPMDFSPAKEDPTAIPVSSGYEKPSFDLGSLGDHWAGLRTEDTVEWMRFKEENNSEHLRPSASYTRYQNNQADTSLNNATFEEPMTFEQLNQWKITGFEEGPTGYQIGSDWPSQRAREDDFEFHQDIGSSVNEANLTFAASSSDTSGQTTNLDTDSLKYSNFGVDFESTFSNSVYTPRDYVALPKVTIGKDIMNPHIATANTNIPQTSAAQMNVSSPSSIKSAAAEQVCERWRLRGNQAYANGDFPKAEEYYSRGANSVSPSETSQSCIRASMLCYSNRAATRMAVGRMREALADCKRAMVVDPSFLRVRLRAASCHLALGETKSAAVMFKECIKLAKEASQPDHKILAEALEGAKKTQQVDDYTEKIMELLKKDSITESISALRLVSEAISISSYSESLHELKAQVLLSIRRYDEVLQLCEQSLLTAERNHSIALNEHIQDSNPKEYSPLKDNLHLKLWRWRLCAKALYHLGRLDEALDLLKKHAEMLAQLDKTDPCAQFMANIRDMLRHKAAGNEAFQQGKHAEAVEHYSAALACNGDSRPFNAVCFCNRAAASQALGHIADAIADCSRAIALDPSYAKAVSRRATLHELIRDYGQTCNDLRRLITILENTLKANSSTTMKGVSSNNNVQDLKQARDRLRKGEEDLKKGLPIDHYLVLGLESSCTPNEIKKAYRKAALKHHPDKAGQFLTRAENGDDGSLWKEVGEEVRMDSERLFKLIGEAYAILSDQTKRLRYDSEEERRKLKSKEANSQGSSDMSDLYSTHFGKSGRHHRERYDAWSAYAHNQRWQTGPDAAQPDTYARRNMYNTSASRYGNASRNTEFSWDDI